jgi:hypothetical protein
MSDRIVLRQVYALDSRTGLFISSGSSLVTDGRGGTTWSGVLDSLSTFGGPMVSFLPSTLSTFSTIGYINSSNIKVLESQIANATGTFFTDNLGTVGYISSASLQSSITSTVAGLGSIYISSASLQSSLTSTVAGLGSVNYVSSSWLQSTVTGLGSLGYISSITTPISFQSTVAGLGSSGYVSSLSLQSTVAGLGSSGYISSLGLQSTVAGLSASGYVSSLGLQSTVAGLGSSRYVSTSALQSTVAGLGSSGYISSLGLNLRFDNTTTISIIGGTNSNTFTNIGNLYYVSTFFQSSMTYTGPQRSGVQQLGNIPTLAPLDMEFSTATIRLDAFSSFTNASSRITIDAYPTILFSKLGTGSAITTPLCFPISTLLKYGNTLLYNTTTTNYLFAGNGMSVVSDPVASAGIRFIDSSNAFNQPIRLSIPQNTVLQYANTYSLYHYMPGAMNNAGNQTALHNNTYTPYYGSTGSIFVSVQNSV